MDPHGVCLKPRSLLTNPKFQLQGVLVTTMTTERMKTITPTPRGHREETRKSIADGCWTKLSEQFVGMYKLTFEICINQQEGLG